MSPASPVQGRFASRLDRALGNFVEEHELGELYVSEPGFILQQEPMTIRSPNVAFIQRDRIPPVEDQDGFWAIAPDLVVEIISPSETAQIVEAKVRDYLAAGTRLIWLIYPRLALVIEYQADGSARRLIGDASLDGGKVVPGFRYPLRTLFR